MALGAPPSDPKVSLEDQHQPAQPSRDAHNEATDKSSSWSKYENWEKDAKGDDSASYRGYSNRQAKSRPKHGNVDPYYLPPPGGNQASAASAAKAAPGHTADSSPAAGVAPSGGPGEPPRTRATVDRKYGTLYRWWPEKGFGFVRSDEGGEDIFMHKSAIRKSDKNVVAQEQRVSFTMIFDPKNKKMKVDTIAFTADNYSPLPRRNSRTPTRSRSRSRHKGGVSSRPRKEQVEYSKAKRLLRPAEGNTAKVCPVRHRTLPSAEHAHFARSKPTPPASLPVPPAHQLPKRFLLHFRKNLRLPPAPVPLQILALLPQLFLPLNSPSGWQKRFKI